jgi:hypothetical protein
MVLKLGDRFYYGAACIHMLAVLSTSSGLFNRATATLFRSPAMARGLYPLLRAGRNLTLALLGRRKMSSALSGREGRSTSAAAAPVQQCAPCSLSW